MASSYPGGLDAFTNPTASDTLDSATVPHAAQHSNANDAIEAIESTLGVNPQGSSATVVARLTALDSTVAGKAPATGIDPTAIAGTAVITTDARLSDTRVPTDASVTDAKIATTLSPLKITGTAVITTDSRLTDSRTPTAHASTHGVAGSDPVTVASSQVTGLATSATTDTTNASNITSGTLAAARVATLNQNTTGTAASLSAALSTTLGGTGVTTGLTVLDGGNLTASTVTNAKLVNSSVTVNGSDISLGGSATVTAVPSGSAGGDLTGTFPSPTLVATGTAGTYTKVTTDAQGRVTSGTTLVLGDLPSGVAKTGSANAFTVGNQTITNGASETGVTPLILKGAASQTASLLEVQNSSGTAFVSVLASGTLQLSTGSRLNISGATGAKVDILTSNVIGVGIKGGSTQILDLVQLQNSAGTILGGRNAVAQIFTGSTTPITSNVGGATTAASGTGTTATITTTTATNLAVGDIVVVAGVTPTGYNTTGSVVTAVSNTSPFTVSYANTTTGSQTVAGTVATPAQASITPRSAGTKGLLFKGASGQTENLTEWQQFGANVVASISATGIASATRWQTLSALAAIRQGDNGGDLFLARKTATPAAPGATVGMLYFRDGTTAGTLKLVVRAGAAGAETTILDNIPQ